MTHPELSEDELCELTDDLYAFITPVVIEGYNNLLGINTGQIPYHFIVHFYMACVGTELLHAAADNDMSTEEVLDLFDKLCLAARKGVMDLLEEE
jgi:hypothetical protein